MSLDFPTPEFVGQGYTSQGVSWRWSGSAWEFGEGPQSPITYLNVTEASNIGKIYPSDIQAGDLLIMGMVNISTAYDDVDPTGFTMVARVDYNGPLDVSSRIYYRICDGSETGNIANTVASNSRMSLWHFRVVSGLSIGVTVLDAQTTDAGGGSGAAPPVTVDATSQTARENRVILIAGGYSVADATVDQPMEYEWDSGSAVFFMGLDPAADPTMTATSQNYGANAGATLLLEVS